MANSSVHLSQARHNEEVADRLISDPPYHDWAITAGFYAAIHYFESWLFNKPEQHSETSRPKNPNGSLPSVHAWRLHLIQQKLTPEAFKSYEKLKVSSENARYLDFPNALANFTAFDYFTPTEAEKLVRKNLGVFKGELNIQ